MDVILKGAHDSALRRAEMMDWTDVSVQQWGECVIRKDQVKEYSFEIWGRELISINTGDSPAEGPNFPEKPASVAKEADL